MAPRPITWTIDPSLTTPGLYWEPGNEGLDSPRIREMLLALDGTYGLQVKMRDADERNTYRIVGERWPANFSAEEVIQALVNVLNVLPQASGLEYVRGALSHLTTVLSERLRLRSIRILAVQQVRPGPKMGAVTALIKTAHIQHLPMQVLGLARGSWDSTPLALVHALDHNTRITSTCLSRQCSPFLQECSQDCFCAVGTVAFGNGWLPGEAFDPEFEVDFENWYYAARTVAICRRNAELERRVHRAVFRLLPVMRVTLNAATGSEPRLPPEVLEHIFLFLGDGALTTGQVNRLREHAMNREESARVGKALKKEGGGTKEEWLFNGGFWWQMGYAAAKEELGYNNRSWPPIEDTEAVLRFLAFSPIPTMWHMRYGRGETVEAVMRKYETSV